MQKEYCKELCCFTHDFGEQQYMVLLEADTGEVSLEGMNRYFITITDENMNQHNILHAMLDLNLREEMNSVSIEGSSPHYFTITGRSLDINDTAIDSSIHDVVDLGILDQQVLQGIRPGIAASPQSLLLEPLAGLLIKACISTLLAQASACHKHVIQEAGHLFASRQDYVRDMCNCIAQNSEGIVESISSKTRAYDDESTEKTL